MTTDETILLGLLRRCCFDGNAEVMLSAVNWPSVFEVSVRQGVSSLLLDALSNLSDGERPPHPLLLQMIGRTAMMERGYAHHRESIASLAAFYARHGIRMMLLKGYGCSLCWPRPEHRPVGDIDVFLFGKQVEGDVLVESELGIKVRREYHKHSTFVYRGVEVENHAKFIDDVSHKSNIRFERTLVELLRKEKCVASPLDNVLLPPPTFNALFLLRHTGEHFASNEIMLRHVVDVGTFFMRYHASVDWPFLFGVLRRERMTDFFGGIATICVECLGMDAKCFSSVDGRYSYNDDMGLAGRILDDVFEVKADLPMSMAGVNTLKEKLKYGVGKSCRWWRNRWKYRLVYDENLFESFWYLARNRMG